MNDWKKLLSEVLIGCATTASQREFEFCMKMLYSQHPQSISEQIVDEAFEGYKNQRHAVVSCCPNFLNKDQEQIIKKGITTYLDNQKTIAKNILRSRDLLR